MVFDAEGDKFRNKRIEDYITVSVVIDMEGGNTKRNSRRIKMPPKSADEWLLRGHFSVFLVILVEEKGVEKHT